jgi:SET domain-containing protein
MRLSLEVFRVGPKGWGVRAREAIPRGAFVAEYVGELIDDKTATKRGDCDIPYSI